MQAIDAAASGERELCAFYNKVRSYTEELCRPLEVEDFIPQPVDFVSPTRWNIAHTTWFFEEMVLKKFVPDHKVFDEAFGFLFNSYYNSIGARTTRDHRGDLSRPTVKQVFKYRRYVDEKMNELLSQPGAVAAGAFESDNEAPLASASGSDLRSLVILGLNHEQQHQELLLTDIKYVFSLNPLFPAYRQNFAPEEKAESGAEGFVELSEGIYEVGYKGNGFCFDNELAAHKVYLDRFEVADRLVTNFEYLTFIQDDGYLKHRLWHADGWDWVNQNSVTSPLYWQQRDGQWFQFTLGGLRPLTPDAPVCHISFYEAAAFAAWRELRLPTEFEWEAACSRFNWGQRWEWTNSAYLNYPGFRRSAGAVGEYNGKFMINQMVLRGASVATPDVHSRPTYRNFFQPHLRWQFTGIRLAR
jgi:ergothioneine biosynthesis protein EgtB